MPLYLTALNPTDAVTLGLLPAARRLGLDTVLLTDQPDAHRAAYTGLDVPVVIERVDVRDAVAIAAAVRDGTALLSNSDHLQTPAALAADYFRLPGKDWRAAIGRRTRR